MIFIILACCAIIFGITIGMLYALDDNYYFIGMLMTILQLVALGVLVINSRKYGEERGAKECIAKKVDYKIIGYYKDSTFIPTDTIIKCIK